MAFPLIGRHTIPVFAGAASRSHRARPLWRLAAEAALSPGRFPEAAVFVQFAGFPRSGHSLVGSILDAHPGAVVSHELDAMGLFDRGFSERQVFALIARNSAEFERNGRWWNGFSYAIEGGAGGRAAQPHVIGDKKGDWAVRRVMEDPSLLDRLAQATPRRRRKWILVLRNPFDNVATMSLRKGRLYDRLRIETPDRTDFRRRLEAEKGRGIAGEIQSDMVEDYARLCEGVAAMKARIDPGDWLEIRNESFLKAPEEGIAGLLRFADLAPDPDFIRRAAAIVHPGANLTRHELPWPDAAREAVEALTRKHDFLHGYRFDD